MWLLMLRLYKIVSITLWSVSAYEYESKIVVPSTSNKKLYLTAEIAPGSLFNHSPWTTDIKQRFTFFNVERTWNDAKVICEDAGLTLIKVETLQENEYIRVLASANADSTISFWSGLRRDTVGGEQWTDGSSPITTLYAVGSPTTESGTHCFSISASEGLWTENDCTSNHMFVCETNIGSCTFQNMGLNSGCNGNALVAPDSNEQFEQDEVTCKNTCLNWVNTNDRECWAAAHFPGFNGKDCWLFVTIETNYCEVNLGAYTGVTLFLKRCFEGEVRTITTQTMPTDITTNGETPTVTPLPTSGEMSTPVTPQDFSTEVTTETGDTTSSCTCTCQAKLLPGELEQKIEKIIDDIKVDRKTTSQYRRKLFSAPDGRTSSRVIGVSGVVILIFSCISIVCIDIVNICHAFSMCFHRMRDIKFS